MAKRHWPGREEKINLLYCIYNHGYRINDIVEQVGGKMANKSDKASGRDAFNLEAVSSGIIMNAVFF